MTLAVRFPGRLRRKGRVDPTYALEIAVEEDGEEVSRAWIRMAAIDLLRWAKVKTAVFIAVNLVPSIETAKRESQQERWENFLNEIAPNAEEEEAPGEASDAGLVAEMALEWLSGRAIAETWDEWQIGDHRYVTAGDLILFRARDLRQHLDFSRHLPTPRELWSILSERGFAAGVQKVEGKSVKCWWLPADRLEAWERENGYGSDRAWQSAFRQPVASGYQGNHGVTKL